MAETSGYEKKDVSVKVVVIVAILSALLLVAFVVLLDDYFVYTSQKDLYARELSVPSKQLEELHQHEKEALNSYKIVDQKKGIYQIPIDRAMKLTIAKYAR